MPHYEIAICPQCGIQACGKDKIEKLFGFRYDGTVPQSWCRACRSSRRQEEISFDDGESYGESNESISVYDAALIWISNGKDEDYMFGYSEEELEEALK